MVTYYHIHMEGGYFSQIIFLLNYIKRTGKYKNSEDLIKTYYSAIVPALANNNEDVFWNNIVEKCDRAYREIRIELPDTIRGEDKVEIVKIFI